MKPGVWMFAALLALIAGWTDWRSRRIPNWITLPSLLLGLALNAGFAGWSGAKQALLGAGLGLALLLPFVLLRSLGGGDWKLVGALGAFLGPERLITVLVVSLLVAGAMAMVLVIYKRRVRETAYNLAHIAASLVTLRLPGPSLTLDNPESLRIPFGVAVAIAVILYTAGQAWAVA